MRHMTEISEIKVYIHGLFFYLYLIYESITIFFYFVLIYQIKEKGHHLIILLANLKIIFFFLFKKMYIKHFTTNKENPKSLNNIDFILLSLI